MYEEVDSRSVLLVGLSAAASSYAALPETVRSEPIPPMRRSHRKMPKVTLLL